MKHGFKSVGVWRNYLIKRDLRENTGFKIIIGRVGPLFWLLESVELCRTWWLNSPTRSTSLEGQYSIGNSKEWKCVNGE